MIRRFLLGWYDAVWVVFMWPIRRGLVGRNGPIFQAWAYFLGVPLVTVLARSAIDWRCDVCRRDVSVPARCTSRCCR
jgi:hypothetical protein